MSALGNPIPREPFVDANGRVTPIWTRWLYDLYARVGGAGAPSITEIAVDMPEDSGAEETRALLYASQDATNMLPPAVYSKPDDYLPPTSEHVQVEFLEMQMRDMAEQIAALRTELDGLKQGAEL